MNKIPPVVIAIIGFIVYSTANIVSIFSDYANYIKMLAVVVILWGFIKSPKYIDKSKTALKVFAAYTIFIFLRGSLLGNLPVDGGHEVGGIYTIIRYALVYQHSALAFIVILFFLIPFDKREIHYYRILSYICTFLCLFAIISFRNDLFNFNNRGVTSIIRGDGFLYIRQLISMCFIGLALILLQVYSQKSLKISWISWLSIFVIVLYGFAQVAGGGRGGSFTALLYLAFLVYFLRKGINKGSLFNTFFKWVVIVVLFYAVYYVLFQSNYTEFLYSRLFEDGELGGELRESTRVEYVDSFFKDFNNHPWAWIIGKGCNGNFMLSDGTLRSSIEWGYLHLILKGGVLYLFLYVYLLLKSFYIGFFKSNNQFTKAMAVLCLICAYSLIPFGLPEVSVGYVLVWRYVRFINTPEIRLMSDEQIKALS